MALHRRLLPSLIVVSLVVGLLAVVPAVAGASSLGPALRTLPTPTPDKGKLTGKVAPHSVLVRFRPGTKAVTALGRHAAALAGPLGATGYVEATSSSLSA